MPSERAGRLLLPWIDGQTPTDWRTEVHWEYDFRDPAEINNLAQDERFSSAVLAMASKMLSWRMANDERELTAVNVSRDRIYSRHG